MTKIGRACFILGIFLQTGWGRTLITSCSPWWWSWETFSATWAPANETSLARSYWNERGERLELAGCMLIMLLSWGSLRGACVDSAPIRGFLLFLYIYFFFMSGECEPRCDSSGNGEPRREAFWCQPVPSQSPRSFARLFQDRSQTVSSYQLPSTAHVLGMRNDNQSTPPAGRQADGQMISTRYF